MKQHNTAISIRSQKNSQWWTEEYGFFGEYYLEGDNSKEGYLAEKKQSLKERTSAEVNGIINILQLGNGEKILDIPCGSGRHSIELTKRGLKVIGSDLNHIHLKKAIEDAKKEGVKLKLTKENMINLPYNSEFDAVINMFYSFGFFETDEENLKVLQNFFNVLKPGGNFLFHTDVSIPRILKGKYKEEETRNLVSGNKLKIIDKYDPKTKRINGCWIIKNKDGTNKRKDYSVRVYTKNEFIELCKQVGFRKFEAYSDWEKNPYNEDSEDMIIVAQK